MKKRALWQLQRSFLLKIKVKNMAIKFLVEKTKNYTVMSNHHLKNTDLSLKGKGLLSLNGNVRSRRVYPRLHAENC